jgi:putative addiction module antidote
MGRKIFRSGNSTVVSIPLEALEALDLDTGDQVNVVADPDRRRIIITPSAAVAGGKELKIREQLEQFVERYGPALERLARQGERDRRGREPGIDTDALERAERLRQEFAAHGGVLTVDLVQVARSERESHVNDLLALFEDKEDGEHNGPGR